LAKDVLSYKKNGTGTPAQNKPSANLYIPAPNQALFLANLEAIGSELNKLIAELPETALPVDDDVKVEGLKNPTYLVIIGFSGPKIIEAAKKSKKEISHVLIIEPDLKIFKQTLMRSWIGGLSKDASVDLLIGIKPDEMMPHIYRIFTHSDKYGNRASRCQNTEIIIDPFAYPPVDGKVHPMADQIVKIVTDASKQVFLSMGSAPDSFFRFEQLVRNEKALQNSYRIEPTFGKFSDFPVIVLGAGPSLKDFVDTTLEYKLHETCLVIACDAALPVLLAHNVKPHIVTRCERKLTTIFNSVKKEDTKDVFYAAYPWCPPEYFDLFQESFMLFRGNGVCKWSGYNPGEVNGGVSSANAALELAYLLGAKDIILSGVDLCFIDGRSHVEGTEVEFDPEKSKAKWHDVVGNSGQMVTTIPVWYRCLNEYMNTITRYDSQATVYNTSKGGVKIVGTKFESSFDELAKKILNDKVETEAPIARLRKYLEKPTSGYLDTYNRNKASTIEFLQEMRHAIKKLLGNVDDLMLIAGREELKTIGQLKGYQDPVEFYANVASIRKSLSSVYQEPNRQIEAFKAKYFPDKLFNLVILDTIQNDFFSLENRVSALKNTIDTEHERLKVYAVLNTVFLRTVEYYCGEYIKLFESGPDQSIRYNETLEKIENAYHR